MAATAGRPQEQNPLFEKSIPGLNIARFLKDAPTRYRDIPPEGSFPLRPRPPEKTSAPLPPDGDRTPAVAMAAETRMMQSSQSDSALEGANAVPSRRTYGGKLVGGQFVRSSAENVDDMTEAEKQECLDDIERRRQAT